MSENLEEVGARIRATRAYRDLRAEAIAKEVGLAPSSVSRLEAGEGGMKLEVLAKIADFLQVPISTFTDGLKCDVTGKCKVQFSEK